MSKFLRLDTLLFTNKERHNDFVTAGLSPRGVHDQFCGGVADSFTAGSPYFSAPASYLIVYEYIIAHVYAGYVF